MRATCPRIEPPAAAIDKAAAQHRDQVAEPPSVGRQAQQPPDPDAERAIGERFAGHGVQRQVVLGEHLPRQAEDRTEPAERHSAVRWPQAAVVGEPALDGARHGAQLRLAIGGNAPLHPRGRPAPAGAFDHRIREQPAQALVRVAGALTRVGIERQQQVAVAGAGERGEHEQLAAVEEPEAVDDHQEGQRGRVPGSRGRGRQRRRGEPPVLLQGAAIGAVDRRDRRELRVAGGGRRRHETVRGDILGQQLLHRRPQHRQRGRRAERREVRGVAGGDLPVRDAGEQLARGADRGGGKPGADPAGHPARGLHLQVERHAARGQQPPAELVAMPDRRHHHQGCRERVQPIPLRRPPDQRLGLPGPGRPDDEGRVCDGRYRTVTGSAASTDPDHAGVHSKPGDSRGPSGSEVCTQVVYVYKSWPLGGTLIAQDATLHVKIDPATNEELTRLAAARKTSKGQLVRDAIFACYQVPLSELPIQRHALVAFVGGYISIGKLAEALGMHVLDLRRWLSEHGIEQNTAMSADDHMNA